MASGKHSLNTPGAHLGTVLTWGLAAVAPERRFGAPRRRKSPQNPSTLRSNATEDGPTRISALRSAFQPAGSGDFPVACISAKRPHNQEQCQ